MKPYILRNENALYYECGFSCDNAIFIKFNSSEALFLTDSRYTEEAKKQVKNAAVITFEKDLVKNTKILIKKSRIKFLYFDPTDFTVAQFETISKNLNINFIPRINFSLKRREIKSVEEIEIIKQAAYDGALAFDKFRDFIQKSGFGMSEQELGFNAQTIFKDNGRLGLGFTPIVAINENASKPHAFPTQKILNKSDLLLLDAGVQYNRYRSDRTRTVEASGDFNFSKTQKFKYPLKQKVYDIVLKAQEAAIKSVKIGVKASDIDKAAREVIDKAGFGKYFIHSTGHGVGLDIHELPVISSKSETIIKEGMVFTIEPGIYLPNEFGVRIEDMLVVQNGEAKIL